MGYVVAIVISLVVGGGFGYWVAPDVKEEIAKVKAQYEAEKARIKAQLKAIETDLQADVATLRARVAAIGELL